MRPSARRTTRYLTVILIALAAGTGSTAAATGSFEARLIVKLHAGVASNSSRDLFSAVAARHVRTISDLDVQVIAVPSGGAQSALAALRKSRLVAYAERDAILKPQELLPNDPSFPREFAVAGGAWGWYATHTTRAWDITRGDSSVIVAILDTGLKTQGLSDYDGQVVSGWNVMRNSTDTSSFAGNHGTYVAGVVGLALGNGVGNTGYCPECKIMPVQVGTDSGATWSDLATGITWAADHGARVENMSWAGTSPSATIASAVAYARSRGVVVTAAAGNSNCDCPTFPSATPGVIGVAGTKSTDSKESDSNYGSWVKVAAPEAYMTSWPTLNGSPGYGPVGGTSLAAPVVAAIAGLLFSANPALSGTQVEQALEASAVPVGFSVQYGRVDALGALNYLGFSDPQSSAAPKNTAAPSIYFETNGDYNYRPLVGAPAIGSILLRGQGSWEGSAPLRLTSLQWERCDAVGFACATVSTTAKYTVQAADAGYAFRLLVTISNGLGSTTMASSLSLPVGGSAPVPTAPQNIALPAITGTAQVGQALTSSAGSWSGSPTAFAYQWSRCDASGGACSDLVGATSPSYSTTALDAGVTLRVAVTASNSAGSSTAVSPATAAVAAAPATPPPPATTQTLSFSGSLTPKNGSRSFSVDVGQGPTHATLSFSKCSSLDLNVYSGPTKITSARGPSVVTLDQSLAAGTYIYEVTGGRCSFTLTLSTQTP